ncbi:MAG: bifunctional 23S rRNA (guanine(2069)-N(7))-methyltransferase RlmK/23S rRNA (guanine(2445)-N(2))-methyltransferase RlmL, partial [Phycisphaerales bacterium]|nr:bifunctional 23S rRNA (guanine(2069)-N(7))-methyltransferase RlmK/23S rRNA (guanine(2445)-N(2))-methyltransferase RlmL [Phycisphaerales bacterium]
MDEIQFIATAPTGIEPLLAAELTGLGAVEVKAVRGGIRFQGPLELAYRACLWSRTASRVILILADFPTADADALYKGIHDLPWEEHLNPDGTLAVDFGGICPGIDHPHYGAQRVKDAIVDRFRARLGQRPSVERTWPDLRIQVQSRHGQTWVGLDLSGDSLHRRGYRVATVTAPLKETLAAALLLKAGWPEIAAAGGSLLDPLCGSGTLAIEAAWIAGDRAPSLSRVRWGFDGWLGHVPALWKRLLNEAQQRWETGLNRIPPIFASDHDPKAVRAALLNANHAEVADRIAIKQHELANIEPPDASIGLLIANPPYGERLGAWDELTGLYQQLGERLKTHFSGWRAAILTGNPELGKRMGLRAEQTHVFHNGPLECRLLRFRVEPTFFIDRAAADQRARTRILQQAIAHSAEGFINRLRKNLRHFGRWAEREGVHCYRLYDADLPEYA